MAVPWRMRDVALLLVLGIGALLLSLVGVQGLYQLEGGAGAVPAQPPAVLPVMAADLFYLVILVGTWWLVRRYGATWSDLGLRRPRRATLPRLLVLCAILAAGTAAIVAGAMIVLGQAGIRSSIAPDTMVPAAGDPLFIAVVLESVLLAPLAEELLYRGLLYQAMRKHVGVVVSTIGSALLFAVLHPSLAMAPEFFLLGIVLAAAYEWTHSLYPSMLIHAAYNAALILVTLRLTA